MTKGSDNPFPSVLLAEQVSAPTTPASGNGRLYIKSDGLYIVDDGGNEFGPFATSEGPNYVQGARVYNSVAFAHSVNNTWMTLTFDSERYDTDSIHDMESNTSRLTCKTAGKYLIIGQISWTINATGNRGIRILLGGVTEIADIFLASAGGTIMPPVVTIYDLSENEYVELQAYQNSGGSLDIQSTANFSPEFMMQRIG